MSTLERIADEIIITDVLIVGSEGAGARAALEASKACKSVVVATKGVVGKSGATLTADADIDIDSRSAAELFGLPGDLRDSPEKFAEDMCKEGEYLNDQYLVKIHCNEAPERLKELVDWGARIDKLTHAPGHTYPRGVWIPGTEFARVLTKELKKRDNIRLLEHMMITDILLDDGAVAGACGVEMTTGKFFVIKAKAIILCTGGAMRIYPHTTAPDELTGDGLAMAYRVGAKLVDMEFPMFLPYTLMKPESLDGVDFPYLLSAYVETHALNRHGERYMKKWDPERLEHSTRDVNSIAAMVEVLEGRGSPSGGTYLSLKHLPDNLIEFSADWFPASIANWRYGGFNMKDYLPDLRTHAMETSPASHFWNGGIKINEFCETGIPGLYAAGEGTGSIHGANRVSGNALTMTQVWGPRAGLYASKYIGETGSKTVDLEQVMRIKERLYAPFKYDSGVDAIALRKKIQEVAWTYVGVVREEKGLKKALDEIACLRDQLKDVFVTNKSKRYNMEWIESMQLENMLDVLEMVARASLVRQESRGALYRRDFPKTDNINWVKNIIIEKKNGDMSLSVHDVKLDTHKPKKIVRDYGFKE
ncbi:MAG TPA: FAD-binding protein [Bacillota bacterium]|nr:FAD-binding protein [Bacillota bacterium]